MRQTLKKLFPRSIDTYNCRLLVISVDRQLLLCVDRQLLKVETKNKEILSITLLSHRTFHTVLGYHILLQHVSCHSNGIVTRLTMLVYSNGS